MSSLSSGPSMMTLGIPASYGLVTGVVGLSYVTTHLFMTWRVVQARKKCALLAALIIFA